jgi:putative SOS response-associated peptidase YedK
MSLISTGTLIPRYKAQFLEETEIQPTYYINSFSLPKHPVITNEDKSHFQMFTWGLIPFWVKKQVDADKIRSKTMNARAETLFEKPSFRNSIKFKRCLIPSDGFFEWRYFLGKNYPYFIRLRNKEIFSFAGIWDNWKNPETSEIINTFSIITCEPNDLLRKIHNKKQRMPVILPKEKESIWLNHDLTKEEINNYLSPYPVEELEAYTISRLITSKTQEKNIEEVIKPYNYPELVGLD